MIVCSCYMIASHDRRYSILFNPCMCCMLLLLPPCHHCTLRWGSFIGDEPLPATWKMMPIRIHAFLSISSIHNVTCRVWLHEVEPVQAHMLWDYSRWYSTLKQLSNSYITYTIDPSWKIYPIITCAPQGWAPISLLFPLWGVHFLSANAVVLVEYLEHWPRQAQRSEICYDILFCWNEFYDMYRVSCASKLVFLHLLNTIHMCWRLMSLTFSTA